MISVVIDTGVLISAAFRDRTPEEVVLFVVENPDIEWIGSAEIVQEYFDVLGRKKFGLSSELLESWKHLIEDTVLLIDQIPEVEFTRDVKDTAFIGCAVAGGAHYLITGDSDFQDARKMIDTTIISVKKFKELVMDNWLDLSQFQDRLD